jgi:hypothetical protein
VGGGVLPHADAALVVDVLAVEGVASPLHGLKRLGVPVPYFNQYEPGPVATEVYAGEDVGLVAFDVEAEKVDVFYAVLVEQARERAGGHRRLGERGVVRDFAKNLVYKQSNSCICLRISIELKSRT